MFNLMLVVGGVVVLKKRGGGGRITAYIDRGFVVVKSAGGLC